MITTLTMLIALFTGVGAYFTFKMWKEKHEANIEIRLDSHPIYSIPSPIYPGLI